MTVWTVITPFRWRANPRSMLLQPRPVGVRRQIRRPFRQHWCIRLNLLDHFLNCTVELLVLTFPHANRTIVDFNVRRNAPVFDDPLAVEVVARELGSGDVPAVEQRHLPADAAHTAPCSFADERTELVNLKHLAED